MQQNKKTFYEYKNSISILKAKLHKSQKYEYESTYRMNQILSLKDPQLNQRYCQYIENSAIRIQSNWRGFTIRHKEDCDQQDMKINRSYQLCIQKLKNQLKQRIGFSMEDLFRSLDVNNKNEVNIKQFRLFLATSLLKISRTQIKRCLFLIDEELQSNVTLENYTQVLQAFQCSSENSKTEMTYDQIVLQKIVGFFKNQNLQDIILKLQNQNKTINLDDKLIKYVSDQNLDKLKQRELQALKNIFGENPDLYKFLVQIEKIYRKQPSYDKESFKKYYLLIQNVQNSEIKQKVHFYNKKGEIQYKKNTKINSILNKIHNYSTQLIMFFIRLLNSSYPGQQYFQIIQIKKSLEFYFSQILVNAEILQIIRQFNYEKNGTIHLDELYNFVIKNNFPQSKNQDFLNVKLMFYARKLEIDGLDCNEVLIRDYQINPKKEYSIQEFIIDFQQILNLNKSELVQLFQILQQNNKQKLINSIMLTNLIDSIRKDGIRSFPFVLDQIDQKKEIENEQIKIKMNQQFELNFSQIIEFKQILIDKNIDLIKIYNDLQQNDKIGVFQLKSYILQNLEINENKASIYVDNLDIFKNNKINLRQLQISMQTNEDDKITAKLVNQNNQLKQEIQIILLRNLKIMNSSLSTYFQKIDLDQKGYITQLELKQGLSYFGLKLDEILKISYFQDVNCKDQIKIEDFQELCVNDIQKTNLNQYLENQSTYDQRTAFRNHNKLEQSNDLNQAIEQIKSLLIFENQIQNNKIFHKQYYSRVEFLQVIDEIFEGLSEEQKLIILNVADFQRNNNIDALQFQKFILNNQKIQSCQKKDVQKIIKKIKNNSKYGLK